VSSTIDKEKSEQMSRSTKNTMPRRRANASMVQNVLLIWLDNNIDEEDNDCRNTIIQLRQGVNNINTFTDGDQCVNFVSKIKDNKACIIISGSLGQQIVPTVHDMSQVDSIFILSDNKKHHEEWAKDWPKIKGVFTEIKPICEGLKQAAQQCEHNAISISFISTSDADASKNNLDHLDCSFMYTQILKEILLSIEFEEQHIKQFTNYCREVFASNTGDLNNFTQFEQKYREKTPIWWYTYECFLYPMLNRALRIMDMEIIIKLGFFISDLHRHIERLHLEQFGDHHSREAFTVYRGQGLSKTDFDQIMKTKGGLMSFNNFLSTSKDRCVSLMFAESNQINPDLVGILFVMTIDPATSSTPFASINNVSHFQDVEEEVLFSMHTVFRIREIKSMGENNRLWQVDLTLSSDNDQELRALTERMHVEIFPDSKGWHRLGMLLLKMGQPEKAQQVYEVMLEQATDDYQKAGIYGQLGRTIYNQGEYEEAITFYEKSHEIYEKILPPNHINLAASYNNIGLVYDGMGEYSKALTYYEKALEIQQKSLPLYHSTLAVFYNNISTAYRKMGKYSKALSSHEKALEIQQKSLPSNHPDLAASYNNIGLVYYKMGEYSKALPFFEKALEIWQTFLPSNHPDLAMSYNDISLVYAGMGEYSKALTFCEKAFEIQQKALPSNHPDLALSYNNIGMVYYNMCKCSKALSSHEKALEIRQKSLPSNHPDLASTYNNIGEIYRNMGDYWKALSFFERATDIGECSLPPTHPDLYVYRGNLDLIIRKIVTNMYFSKKEK
jgi:tetratricopeptide (TPR) repeat protein